MTLLAGHVFCNLVFDGYSSIEEYLCRHYLDSLALSIAQLVGWRILIAYDYEEDGPNKWILLQDPDGKLWENNDYDNQFQWKLTETSKADLLSRISDGYFQAGTDEICMRAIALAIKDL